MLKKISTYFFTVLLTTVLSGSATLAAASFYRPPCDGMCCMEHGAMNTSCGVHGEADSNCCDSEIGAVTCFLPDLLDREPAAQKTDTDRSVETAAETAAAAPVPLDSGEPAQPARDKSPPSAADLFIVHSSLLI